MILSLLAVGDEPEYDSVTGNLVPEISIPESLLYALVGFLVTFFGIVLLIFIVWLCGKIVGKLPSLGGKKKAAPAAAVVPVAAAEEEVSAEVRVAIVAAIAAYYASENAACEFQVKRIKRL